MQKNEFNFPSIVQQIYYIMVTVLFGLVLGTDVTTVQNVVYVQQIYYIPNVVCIISAIVQLPLLIVVSILNQLSDHQNSHLAYYFSGS